MREIGTDSYQSTAVHHLHFVGIFVIVGPLLRLATAADARVL